MTLLAIRLPAPDAAAAAAWPYALSTDGQTVARHDVAPPELLPKSGVHETVVVVPVQALSWHVVDLPRGSTANPSRLRTVLEGLLEDNLLQEPTDLHLALAPHAQAPCRTWVAACQAPWLKAALQTLENAGVVVSRIVPELTPDALPLPDAAAETAPATTDDARLHAIAQPNEGAWWVRSGSDLLQGKQAPGLLLWPLPPPDAATLAQSALPPNWPATAQGAIYADPAAAQAAEHWSRQTVTVQHPAQRWLRAAQAPWNLAQFGFATGQSQRWRKRTVTLWQRLLHAPQWVAVRWGLVLLLLVQLAGLNWWAWRTRQMLAAQRQEINTILTSTFPEVQAVVDAPVQMQKQVDLLAQSSGQLGPQHLEALLLLTSQALPQAQVQGIQWEAGQLRLKGLTVTAEQQQQWQTVLQQHHVSLRQDGTDWLLQAGS
ncbi:MAG: type II secretion system protein GspL [Brachymonas sp.]|nr:type II secretion system protein GspL [Brachymonas sp.]